jgi:hypothetical protein
MPVADWAWDNVAEFLQDKQFAEELWPGWNRWTPTDAHKVAVKAAALRPALALRCSRHAQAVRAPKVGTPIAMIGAQLGHGSPQPTLTRYGGFMPQTTDRDRWEKFAAARDAEMLLRANGSLVAFQAPIAAHGEKTNKPRKPLVSRGLSNSRGGTRTRDPGIMSAVL